MQDMRHIIGSNSLHIPSSAGGLDIPADSIPGFHSHSTRQSVIIDNEFSYSTYLDWVKEHAPEYIGEYSYNHLPKNGAIGKVVAVDIRGRLFIEVKEKILSSFYLIDSEGVELI